MQIYMVLCVVSIGDQTLANSDFCVVSRTLEDTRSI